MYKESSIIHNKEKAIKIKLKTDKWCSKLWIKDGNNQVFYSFYFSNTSRSAKCYDGTIISKRYATTTATTKINGNVSSSSMDGSTIKNENVRTYA
jgi:hypothetical protein